MTTPCGLTQEKLDAHNWLDNGMCNALFRNNNGDLQTGCGEPYASHPSSAQAQCGGGVQGQEFIEIMEKLDALKEEKVVQSKLGSSLNSECVDCFGASIIPKGQIPTMNIDEHFETVKNLIYEYTMAMHDLLSNGNVAEVQYVQPFSFDLFKQISVAVLSEYRDHLRFENKATRKADTEYSTTLHHIKGKTFHVSGKTDGTMLYCGIPIQTWEDKELALWKNLTPKQIGQPLAEIAGMGEIFKARVGVHAPKFCGILTSGLSWTMSFRKYGNGQVTYGRTEVITTWNDNEDKPDDHGINIVTSLLITSLRSAELLFKIVNESNSKLCSVEEHCPDTDDTWRDDNDADSGKSEEGGGGGGDRSNVIKALSTTLWKMCTRSTKSNNEKENGKKNNDKSHGNRKIPLAPIKMNSIISFDNLHKHNNLVQLKMNVDQLPMQKFRNGFNIKN